MKILLRLSLMLAALGKDKFRLVLALGAMAVGIASMILMLALGTGARLEIQALIEKFGKNLFVVRAKEVQALPGRGSGWYRADVLRPEDVAILKQQVPSLAHVIPIVEGNVQVELGRRDVFTTLDGTTPEFLEVQNFRVEYGRFFDEDENADRERVAVVGSFVAGKLANDEDVESIVGETILIGKVPFRVIGQLEEKGRSGDGTNEDDKILIPVRTTFRRLFHTDSFNRLLVQVDDASNLESAKLQVARVLRENRGIAAGEKADFDIVDMIANLGARRVSNSLINGLARIFALVTLAIGGVGIFAVMILNVKDRVGEIGLRRAVGARGRDIAMLFLSEACVLSLTGGVVGLAAGWLAVLVLGAFTRWAMHVDVTGLAIPFATSALLGLASGVFPAIRASHLEPVVALGSK